MIVNPMRGMMMGHPAQEDHPVSGRGQHPVRRRTRGVPAATARAARTTTTGIPTFARCWTTRVRWAAGEAPPVEVRLPGHGRGGAVGGSRPRSARRTWCRYLHLINRTPGGPVRTKASVISEEIPVFELEVRTRFPVSRALMQPAGRELAVTSGDGGARFVVPRVDIHAIVELR